MDDWDPLPEDLRGFGVSAPGGGPGDGLVVPFTPRRTSSATCLASAWRLGTLRGGLKSQHQASKTMGVRYSLVEDTDQVSSSTPPT